MASNIATLSELRASQVASQLPAVRAGFFDVQGFELMQRVAKAFAASTLVPQQYQGNMPNCMIAINMAERIGADPMMVMQNLYIVHGRPGWSAQFLIATFNHCGRFSALRYEWIGERGKDSWGCRAWAIEKDTEQKIVGPDVTIELAKKEGWADKSGSKWKTIPQLMLMYRAAAWMIRAYAPEIAMGLQTAEEIGDVIDVERGADGTFQATLETLRAEDAKVAGAAGATAIDPGSIPTRAPVKPDTAKLIETMRGRSDLDTLDADATLIDTIDDADQRETARAVYHERREQLAQ